MKAIQYYCLFISVFAIPIPLKPAGTLSIATFNSYWLFNPHKLPQSHPACPWKDSYSAHRHLEDVAKIINEVNADIWVLQEVQDQFTLRLLSERLGGGYFGFLTEGTDHKFGMNVAILSRHYPSQKPFRIDRKYFLQNQEVIQLSKNIVSFFSIPPFNFILIGVHLRMPRRGLRGGRRHDLEIELLIEEAKDILAREQQAKGEECLIIAGDYNDVDQQDHPTDYTEYRRKKRISTNNSIPLLKNQLNLHNCLSFVDASQRYTTTDHIAIDHILISNSLAPRVSKVDIYNQPPCMFAVSDHCPLKVEFIFKE